VTPWTEPQRIDPQPARTTEQRVRETAFAVGLPSVTGVLFFPNVTCLRFLVPGSLGMLRPAPVMDVAGSPFTPYLLGGR
jgi:hypothetical protein